MSYVSKRPMSSAESRLESMIEDALARVALLGKTDKDVELGAKLSQAFLNKARKGKNRDPRSAHSWAKLRAWLVEQGVGQRDSKPAKVAVEVTSRFADLAKEIRAIGTSPRKVREAMQSLAVALIEDPEFNAKRAELALATLKATLGAIKLEKVEAAQEKLLDLEIMTEDEVELFTQWRALNTPKGLAPGEAAKPPEPPAGEKKT